MFKKIKLPALMNIIGRVIGFSVAIYIASTLGPEQFAFYAIWLLLLEYLAYSNLSMGAVIFRNISISENKISHKTETNARAISQPNRLLKKGNFKAKISTESQDTINLATTILLMSSFIGFCAITLLFYTHSLPIQMTNVEFCILLLVRMLGIWLGLTKALAKGLGRLTSIAWLDGIIAIIMPLFAVLAITFFDLLGLMVVHGLIALIGIIIFYLNDIWFSFSYSFRYFKFKRLLSLALPLYAATILEASMISLPIILSGYLIEGVILGGFLFLFQNTRPEKIPLYAYFTIANYRSLLIESSNNPKFAKSEKWSDIDLLIKSYFTMTLIGTMILFVILNFISRLVLDEYIEYLPLLAITLPSISFFAIRKIFNAYFSAVNKLTSRLVIYVLCLILSLLFFQYSRSIGGLEVETLAVWISSLALFSSTLGFASFLNDSGHSIRYVFLQLLFIYSCLIFTYIILILLMYLSDIFMPMTFETVISMALISILFFIFYCWAMFRMVSASLRKTLSDLLLEIKKASFNT